jgi:hypothetical protein
MQLGSARLVQLSRKNVIRLYTRETARVNQGAVPHRYQKRRHTAGGVAVSVDYRHVPSIVTEK